MLAFLSPSLATHEYCPASSGSALHISNMEDTNVTPPSSTNPEYTDTRGLVTLEIVLPSKVQSTSGRGVASATHVRMMVLPSLTSESSGAITISAEQDQEQKKSPNFPKITRE